MAFLRFFLPVLLAALAIVSPSEAKKQHRHGIHKLDGVDVSHEVVHQTTGAKLPPVNTTYYFDQLIDHDDPSLGTFKQRYWFNYQYYQPGGPVILMNAGEGDASPAVPYLLADLGIPGVLAKEFNGVAVLLEHRFFGLSSPYPDLSVKSYRVHTIQQAIDDHEYFVKNVKLAMPGGDQLSPDKAPWILMGGSYPGALTSFTMQNKPGLFYAGWASSAVVQAIADYWRYFEPIIEYMPQNCSTDMQAVIAYVDDTVASGDTSKIQALKENFGLGGMVHNDDFASHITDEFIGHWQESGMIMGNGAFQEFCDVLETDDNGKPAGPQGLGLQHALSAWGAYSRVDVNASESPYLDRKELSCNLHEIACFGTYNPQSPNYTNTTVPNDTRSWQWMVCSAFGFWQNGAPEGKPSIVSRMIDNAYYQRTCQLYFPEAFSSPPVNLLTALDVNKQYGGWNVTTERLIFVNGRRDPWREATVAADGSTSKGWDLQPHLLEDGYHCNDLLVEESENPVTKAAQEQAIGYLRTWLADWKPSA
ncbi:peptidase S28 [Trametes coccinea BRFM310]|uniref:Peptidase S28 n=1 Tax=Trametes coccinea (strain BRFM310) TaxID=1353009 RepID=A0A1Y2I951_TRAC3|nr:peptidase S28 [Trametes coccinea BRFM310]